MLSGEYAVLKGAPALVMAVNRFARCTIASNDTNEWRFSSTGLLAQSTHPRAALGTPQNLAADDPARLAAWLVHTGRFEKQLAPGAHVHTDTSELYFHNSKLGLGSSAALTTALAGALHQVANREQPGFSELQAAHRASQGGVGSGLDVACSLHGGLIRFQDGQVCGRDWPADLHYRFIYAGKPASTPILVGRFNRWHEIAQKSHNLGPLTRLIDASTTLADGGINLDNFARYIDALHRLDEAATIGIFSPEHDAIATLARHQGVLYKPCGAGGGDLGVALAESADDLNQMCERLGEEHAAINLEIAPHGLNVG